MEPFDMFVVIAIFVVTIGFCLYKLDFFDYYDDEKIVKYINDGKFYKAIRLYKKYSNHHYFLDTDLIQNTPNDNLETFIRVLYSYYKDEIVSILTQSELHDFIDCVTGESTRTLYQTYEDFHDYFQEKVHIMNSSRDSNINSIEKTWVISDTWLSTCIFIVAMEDTGFLKAKDGKKIDFRSLAIQRYNKYYNMLAYKELYNIMDDCEVKDIITKVLNYNKYEED